MLTPINAFLGLRTAAAKVIFAIALSKAVPIFVSYKGLIVKA